ncbi:hypothetical protein [Halomontanus rarus]|uniref:hypothetical protein n=1 Tax=Halomontanus rarus TaxID=3034020 RepID=UPI0023E815A5|nr:hypothetical protein [Halovivax sp. TS33]
MNRRQLLQSVGVGLGLVLAGCVTADGPNDAEDENGTAGKDTGDAVSPSPGGCPTSHDLGVSPPDEITRATAEGFVERYEEAYVDEFVISDSTTTITGPSTTVTDRTEVESGFAIETSTVWGSSYYEGVTVLAEPVASIPDGIDPLERDSMPEIADFVAEAARKAAVEERDVTLTEDTIRPNSLGKNAHEHVTEALSTPHENSDHEAGAVYYVAGEDRTVRVTVFPASKVTDDAREYFGQYYIDDVVLKRTEGRRSDPRDGHLIECFSTPSN